MAGRPPATSPTGLLVGMCVSIGIALIALVLLVVLWTNQEELKAATDKANSDAQRLMRPGEREGPLADWNNQASSAKSVAALSSPWWVKVGLVMTSRFLRNRRLCRSAGRRSCLVPTRLPIRTGMM